jgi:hypothetical protein
VELKGIEFCHKYQAQGTCTLYEMVELVIKVLTKTKTTTKTARTNAFADYLWVVLIFLDPELQDNNGIPYYNGSSLDQLEILAIRLSYLLLNNKM